MFYLALYSLVDRGNRASNFFFHFHAVFGKNMPHNRLAPRPSGVGALWEILDLPLYWHFDIPKCPWRVCCKTFPSPGEMIIASPLRVIPSSTIF